VLSAAEPARVTVGAAVILVAELRALSPAWAAVKAAVILVAELRALSPAWATVEAAVRLVVEVSADAACRTLSGAAATDELAVRLAVTLMTTKRPTAVELKARSMLAATSTGGCDEPVAVKARSIEPLTSVNTWAAAVMLPDAVNAEDASWVRAATDAMLPDEVRVAAPTWV
jgi:hypothetical protein